MAKVGLAALLTQLDHALERVGPEGVAAALRRHLEQLPPSQRAEFVAIFDAGDVTASSSLLSEIDAYLRGFPDAAQELTEQRWRRGRRWHDDLDDATDDEPSLRHGIDGLYGRVGERFLAGDWPTAIAGYRLLFDAVVEATDNPEGYSASASSDIEREAFARLLRAILAGPTKPIAEWVADAVDTIDTYHLTGIAMPAAEEVIGAHPQPLPDEAGVLRAWLMACERAARARASWDGREFHRLSVELIARLDGIDALGRLARDESYPHRRGAKAAWLDALEDANRAGDARAASAELVAALGPSPDRAILADRLARLRRADVDAAGSTAADLIAFGDDPTLSRLAWLCHDTNGDLTATIANLHAAAEHAHPSVSLAVDILTGRLASLLDRVAFERRSSGGVEPAVGALLLSARPPANDLATKLARALLASIDHTQSHPHRSIERSPKRRDDDPPTLSPYLFAALATVDPEPQHLDAARELIDATAATVLGAKDRHRYHSVAQLIVALTPSPRQPDRSPPRRSPPTTSNTNDSAPFATNSPKQPNTHADATLHDQRGSPTGSRARTVRSRAPPLPSTRSTTRSGRPRRRRYDDHRGQRIRLRLALRPHLATRRVCAGRGDGALRWAVSATTRGRRWDRRR